MIVNAARAAEVVATGVTMIVILGVVIVGTAILTIGKAAVTTATGLTIVPLT